MTRDEVLDEVLAALHAAQWSVSQPYNIVRALKSRPPEKSPEVEELSRCELVRLEIEGGQTDMKLRAHPEILGLMADCLTGLLDGHNAPNYVSFTLNHETRGQFEMIVQRVAGLRPAEVAGRERARADAAEAERDDLRRRLRASEKAKINEAAHRSDLERERDALKAQLETAQKSFWAAEKRAADLAERVKHLEWLQNGAPMEGET